MAEFMVLRNAAAVRTSSPFESFNPSAEKLAHRNPKSKFSTFLPMRRPTLPAILA